jgi:hypothetical protein
MLENRTDPSDLLFRDPLGDNDHPLFKSRSELAQAITKVPHHKLESRTNDFATRTEESLRAYLSQVLQPGTSPRSRPLSDNLRLVILAACAERLSKAIDSIEFTNRFDEAFEFLKSLAEDPLEIWCITAEDLDKATECAKRHVIFTLEPAEITESKCADNIRDEMIHKLYLAEDLSVPINRSKVKTIYNFFVPTIQVAEHFWRNLYRSLSVIKRLPFARKNLEIINKGRDPNLSISVIDPKDCSISMLVLDPLASQRQGFHLYYHRVEDTDRISLARISNDPLKSWIDNTYKPYYLKSDTVTIDNFQWQRVSKKITQEEEKEEE